MTTCALCGRRYDGRRAPSACAACPLHRGRRGCGLVRCPYCGFEQPADPPPRAQQDAAHAAGPGPATTGTLRRLREASRRLLGAVRPTATPGGPQP